MSSPARRLTQVLLDLATRAAPVSEQSAMHEELGGMIDTAHREGRHRDAILHGISTLRTIRPSALAADVLAGNRTRHPLTWIRWTAAAGVAIAIQALTSTRGSSSDLYRLVTVIACVALAYATAAAPKGAKLGWAAITLGAASFVAGDLWYGAAAQPVPFPSVADAMYFATYPLLAIGLVLAFRSHSAAAIWPSLAASVIAGAAAFVLWWRYLDPTMGALETKAKIVAIGYPAFDVLLLVLAGSLAIRSRPLHRGLVLMAVAIATLTLADVGYNIALSNGTFSSSQWIDPMWLSFFAITAAAALHPAVPRPGPDSSVRSARSRW